MHYYQAFLIAYLLSLNYSIKRIKGSVQIYFISLCLQDFIYPVKPFDHSSDDFIKLFFNAIEAFVNLFKALINLTEFFIKPRINFIKPVIHFTQPLIDSIKLCVHLVKALASFLELRVDLIKRPL
jgi:hypothetical protein